MTKNHKKKKEKLTICGLSISRSMKLLTKKSLGRQKQLTSMIMKKKYSVEIKKSHENWRMKQMHIDERKCIWRGYVIPVSLLAKCEYVTDT